MLPSKKNWPSIWFCPTSPKMIKNMWYQLDSCILQTSDWYIQSKTADDGLQLTKGVTNLQEYVPNS